MKTILFFLLILSSNAFAKFEIQTSTGYTSTTDGKTNNTFSDMTNHIFIGAGLDSKERFLIGPNYSMISNQIKISSTTDKLSVTEIGSRVLFYFNTERNYFTAITWNPYASGKRSASGVDADISGWSYIVAFGAVMKMTGNFFLGGSINYHALTVTKSIVGTTAATETTAYTSLMPMLNISLRFK